jgi:hypothetical protein
MAIDKLQIVVDAVWKGKNALDQAGRDLKSTQEAAKKNTEGLRHLASQAAQMGAAFAAAGVVVKKAYDFIGEGADLQQAQAQFENLAGSIGTTAESIDTKLKAATGGMMSQAERMSGASQIISLGLAQNEEDVVRLAKATGTLGLDMQQVILTFANNSKARLDALGLSVEGVTKKAAELEAQGFKGDAFDEAVLIGLEEKMTLLGDASETTAGSMKTIEAAFKSGIDAGKIWMAQKWEGPLKGLANVIREDESAFDKLVVTGAEFNKMMFGVQGVWGPAADRARDNAKANTEVEETFRAIAEAAALTTDEYNDLIPAIEEASAADMKFANSITYGTQEMVARTEEAVRGAGGMDAYRMGVEKSLTTEEAMAVAAGNAAAAIRDANAATEEGLTATENYNQSIADQKAALDELIANQGRTVSAVTEAALSDAAQAFQDNEDMVASSSRVIEEKLTGVYTGLEDTGSQATASSGLVQDYITKLGEIPAEVSTQLRLNISTGGGGAYGGGNVGERAANTYAGGGTGDKKSYGGYQEDFDPLKKFSTGGDFIVPPGYPNDSYRIGVQSGERVTVTPAGQSGGQNNLTINQVFNGSSPNTMNQARDGVLEAARAIGLTGYA